MGATALANKARYYDKKTMIFGIKSGKRVTDNVGREAGFKDQGKEDVVISVETDEDKDIVFQFKLKKGGKQMLIRAYDPNIKDKATTEVNVKNPDLTKVQNDPDATARDRTEAQKILAMMNRSKHGIKNSSLARIANHLLQERKKDE